MDWVIKLVMEELVFEAWLALKSGPSSRHQVPRCFQMPWPAASAEVLQMLASELVTRGFAEMTFTTVFSSFLELS